MRNKIIIILLLIGSLDAYGQQQQTFITPLCWRVSESLDSTIHRIQLVSASAAAILEVGYINNNGLAITLPASQELLNGACECCYDKFPPTENNVIPTITRLSVSQPTFNPFNPGACNSTFTFQTVNVTNIADITVTLDGLVIPFSWDSMTGQGQASATETAGTGIHTFLATITTTNCNPCSDGGTFDCS